jgi:RNA polymerase sigma-70 factor (ECF subfamily)
MSGSSDAELIQRLQARDPEALAAVYDRYGQLAYSLIIRITRDEGIAEDLVQELFLRVWNHAREFNRERGALGVWILSIARHMAIDYKRSAQGRFRTRLRPIENTDHPCFSYKSETAESAIDRMRMVKEAFSGLSSDQKRVLELAYFEGCSQSEIARKLKEPLGTVKSWMRSALERLRMAAKGGVK